MAVFGVELLEAVVVVPVALFQFIPVFKHVDVFQSVVVGVHVVFVGALPDVEHSHVFTVQIDHGGPPCLPVEVNMLGHGALDDGIAHVEIVEVVAGVAEHNRLEVGDSRPLVGEKFIFKALGSEPLVGINGQRLVFGAARSTALYAGLAQLVDDALLVFAHKKLQVDGPPPVELIVLLSALIGAFHIDAGGVVVEIVPVGDD